MNGPKTIAVLFVCQHRMGHYRYTGTRTTGEEFKRCGKKATHVAEYPDRPPFYLCRKHSKTRNYVSELPLTCATTG